MHERDVVLNCLVVLDVVRVLSEETPNVVHDRGVLHLDVRPWLEVNIITAKDSLQNRLKFQASVQCKHPLFEV